jgi:Rrf2 family protein
MQLSKRCEYALRALIDLGIAHDQGRAVLPIRELAAHEELPVKFLEQILLQLKEAGYLTSTRGKSGGYALRKRMSQIQMGDVVRLVDGPLAPIHCVSKTAYAPCTCPDEAHCGLRMLMQNVRNAVSDILDGATLADVVGGTLKRLRRDRVALPFAARVARR